MENKALLFDFDGVVVDSEKYYTIFWNKVGEERLGRKDFGIEIKGSTLTAILGNNFDRNDWPEITRQLLAFENEMPFEYIPGFPEFLKAAKSEGWKTAVVTSSNKPKMELVYAKLPEIRGLFDRIFTSEDFSESKPSPDCYLKAMAYFGTDANHSVVFEDSINGLISGRDSGAVLVGLSTTNTVETVSRYTSIVIPDYVSRTPDGLLAGQF